MHVDSCERIIQEDTLKEPQPQLDEVQTEVRLTDACEYNALASAILALCPPERVMPFSPISKPGPVSDRIHTWHVPDTHP